MMKERRPKFLGGEFTEVLERTAKVMFSSMIGGWDFSTCQLLLLIKFSGCWTKQLFIPLLWTYFIHKQAYNTTCKNPPHETQRITLSNPITPKKRKKTLRLTFWIIFSS